MEIERKREFKTFLNQKTMLKKRKFQTKMIDKIRQHWLEDASFFTLFLILLFFIFILPIVIEHVKGSSLIINFGLILLYLSGIFSCHLKPLRNTLTVVFVVILCLKINRLFLNDNTFFITELILSILNIITLIYLNIKLLFRNSEYNLYRIIGAINVYFLVAVYSTLFLTLLSQFINPVLEGKVHLDSSDKDFGIYIYYSLVSITTVGYGDIYATNIIVKQLSIFLSTFGILYPAIVIAQLISKKEKNETLKES